MSMRDDAFSRRRFLQRTGQAALAAGSVGLLSANNPFTEEARAAILEEARSYAGRSVTIRAVQPITPTNKTVQGLAFQEVYNRFMRANPSIQVTFEYIPWGNFTQALSVAIGGGNAPDVATWIDDQRIPQLAAGGFLTSLTPLIKADKLAIGQIDPLALASNTYKGNLYGLPYYYDARALYYNKDILAKAGVKTLPTTWDEADKLGRELDVKNSNGQYTQLGYVPLSPSTLGGSTSAPGGNSFLFIYGWQNGGEFANKDLTKATVNDPAIVDALAWCVKVNDEVGGAVQQGSFALRYSRGGTVDPFGLGVMAMETHELNFGHGFIDTMKPSVHWGVTQAPYKVRPATWSGVLSAAMPAGGKNQAASWELTKYMLSPETQTYLANTLRWIPTRKSLWSQIPLMKTDPEMALSVKILPTTHIRPPIPNSQQLWDEILRASDNALYHRMSPKAALDAANATIQQGLDKYLKS
jgi:ABC-type glycerol-3-phosphate transport system substrate-binding protein